MCLTYNYFIEERLRLRQAAKKKSLHQHEGVEAALQYGERLVASCGQDQVDLGQGCGEDHLEVESSLLWQVGDKDAAERAVQVSTVKLLDSSIEERFTSNLLSIIIHFRVKFSALCK